MPYDDVSRIHELMNLVLYLYKIFEVVVITMLIPIRHYLCLIINILRLTFKGLISDMYSNLSCHVLKPPKTKPSIMFGRLKEFLIF